MNFETALGSLETIVGKMESGGLPLDQSLKLYEEGMELSRYCLRRLEEARMRVETVSRGLDGALHAAPFDPEGGPSPEAGARQPGPD